MARCRIQEVYPHKYEGIICCSIGIDSQYHKIYPINQGYINITKCIHIEMKD